MILKSLILHSRCEVEMERSRVTILEESTLGLVQVTRFFFIEVLVIFNHKSDICWWAVFTVFCYVCPLSVLFYRVKNNYRWEKRINGEMYPDRCSYI